MKKSHTKWDFVINYAATKGIIIPKITRPKKTKYKTFHEVVLCLAYFQPSTATMHTIIAVANPCNTPTAVASLLALINDNIGFSSKYK